MHPPLPSPLGKRPADAMLPPPIPTTDGTQDDTLPKDPNEISVLKRYQHRARNIATKTHGALPLPPTKATALQAQNDPSQPFNAYKAILRHPNIFFQFALRLPLQSIIDLYAIDKEFHYRVNKYSVGLVHDYAKHHCRLAAHIFSYNLYPELCISDPMLRPMDDRPWLARDVPGFRWIGMVLSREKIVRRILTCLATEGHRVPAGCAEALMKYWVLMDQPTQAKRTAFLRDRTIWTDANIVCMQLLVVKLDMRFADPVLGNGFCQLSRMLLMQRSLSTLWKVLTGRMHMNYTSVNDMIVRTYSLLELDMDVRDWRDTVINTVPRAEWCLMSREYWEGNGKTMPAAIDLVIVQGVKRGLNVQQYLLDFVLYGYVDPKTGRSIPTPRQYRTEEKVVLPGEGFPGKVRRDQAFEILRARLERRPEVSDQDMARHLSALRGLAETDVDVGYVEGDEMDGVKEAVDGLDLMDIDGGEEWACGQNAMDVS